MLTCAECVQAELNCLCQVVRESFCIKGYVLKKRCCKTGVFFFTYLPQERGFAKTARLKTVSSEIGVLPIALWWMSPGNSVFATRNNPYFKGHAVGMEQWDRLWLRTNLSFKFHQTIGRIRQPKLICRISQNKTLLIVVLTPVVFEINFQILIIDASDCVLW